jgi:hypothetical protein
VLDSAHTTNITLPQKISLLLVVVLLAGVGVRSQARVGDPEGPTMREFRGVSIGMSAQDVRKKLGDPANKGDEQDFFIFNDNETAQVIYDKEKKVMALSFDFTSGASEVPTPLAVFGSEVQAKADGSIYKRVSYPKAGYWLSYNRTAGDQGMTSLTFQRLDQ